MRSLRASSGRISPVPLVMRSSWSSREGNADIFSEIEADISPKYRESLRQQPRKGSILVDTSRIENQKGGATDWRGAILLRSLDIFEFLQELCCDHSSDEDSSKLACQYFVQSACKLSGHVETDYYRPETFLDSQTALQLLSS